MTAFVFRISTKQGSEDYDKFREFIEGHGIPDEWLRYYKKEKEDTLIEMERSPTTKRKLTLKTLPLLLVQKWSFPETGEPDKYVLLQKAASHTIPEELWVCSQLDFDELNKRKGEKKISGPQEPAPQEPEYNTLIMQETADDYKVPTTEETYIFRDNVHYEVFKGLVTESPLNIPEDYFNDNKQMFIIHGEKQYGFTTGIIQDNHNREVSHLFFQGIKIAVNGELNIEAIQSTEFETPQPMKASSLGNATETYHFSEDSNYIEFKSIVTGSSLLNISADYFDDKNNCLLIYDNHAKKYFSIDTVINDFDQKEVHLLRLLNVNIAKNGIVEIDALKQRLEIIENPRRKKAASNSIALRILNELFGSKIEPRHTRENSHYKTYYR